MSTKIKSKKRRITLKDLTAASMDPTVQAQLKEKSGAEAVLSGDDLNSIRLFARMTLDVAKQRNPDITYDILAANLARNLKKVKPALRAIMLAQMKKYVNAE